jgi:hypothetical protein
MNRKFVFSLLLFVFVYSMHAGSFVVNSIDSMWVMHTAHSIVNEGNLNLNEFREEVKAKDRYGVRKRNNNIYNYFPYGTSLLAAPFIFLYDSAPSFFQTFVPGAYEMEALKVRLPLEKAIASFITALTTVFIFLIGLQYLSPTRSILLALVFAFATPAWSVLSRGLWQHGPSVLMHSVALLILICAAKNRKLVLYAAPFLVYSFFVRPTNAVAIAAYSIYVFLYYREYFTKFILLLALTSAPFLIINLDVFGKIIPQYFNPNRLEPEFNAVMPLLANLISPSRGLLFLSPVFFFSFLAFIKIYNAKFDDNFKKLSFLSLGIIVCHVIIVSVFPNWWGGHCFGARYMSDLTGYFTFLLIPLVAELSIRKKMLLSVTFFAAVLFSVFVHYRGANAQIVYMWNTYPVNIDSNPSRVWDIYDIQLLRGL